MKTLPWIIAAVGLLAAFARGGSAALVVAALLSVMEVSLSFDNAVVNAAVLRRMDSKWQQRFLTWGILIAVVGMRLVFPILIVAIAAGLGVMQVAVMAVDDPARYAVHLKEAHTGIAAFGGLFLLLVFLGFVCDEMKEVHWIGWVERKLASLGRLEAVEVAVSLVVLLLVQFALPENERLTVMIAGVAGVATFVAVKGFAGLCGDPDAAVGMATRTGAAGFLYLEVLDASFSLDGVIGAFAITTDIVVIMIGLAIGAMFVRSMTVYLVRQGTLEEYRYLEHGAHWGIGALAAIMLVSMRVDVPEVVTGLIGVSLIGLSLLSSIRHRRRAHAG
ncbi:DUF475 domain-containing protein [Gemmata sp. G18]|uniref:DUF475 domain-containing protein n=1 Tax=Gemmata palustris TaxID=2822762 RepID=A0ABS5BNR3_9BACT|nr:DUF475 domain-containing protein [Gemmata palustris]MBP3955372.1 DUF475 domain-containing protein [Gemmata palustris]